MAAQYTPMMTHYLEIKKAYPDTLVFYRLGDFYEMFFDDAKTASHELDLVLTGRNAGAEERVPMCGVPYHAVKSYIQRLIVKGYKVAIVEQLEDPANKEGIIVKRENERERVREKKLKPEGGKIEEHKRKDQYNYIN